MGRFRLNYKSGEYERAGAIERPAADLKEGK